MAVVLMEDGYLHPDQQERFSTNDGVQNQYSENNCNPISCYISEIEEVIESDELIEINPGGPLETIKEDIEGSLFSFDIHGGDDNVYVGVGKSDSSMDALLWTLEHAVKDSSTFVYLIHVFPEIRHIPTPLGKLLKNQVSPEQVENYMAQERGKRRELLQKFLNLCSASKVKVDTILIESDMVGKAILDLIPVLNIKKLVIGTTKSTIRKSKSKRAGIADQIQRNAPEYCDVKIICEGKQVFDQINDLPSPRYNLSVSKSTREKFNDSTSPSSPRYDLRIPKSPVSPRYDLRDSKSGASPRYSRSSSMSAARGETLNDSKSAAEREKLGSSSSWMCFIPKFS